MTELSPAARLDLAHEPYCNCCDLRISSCGKRKAEQQRKEIVAFRTKLASRGWFRAKFPGQCARCGEWFDAGTMIKSEQYGHCRYIGECCCPSSD